ncbi:DNA polymerase III subunit delta [Vibrio europaeus]|uniref:DNA polymerase III subunit delta n=1 Tax=Vibrio europaeus TaxID=300876 RepID=A0A178JIA4_9VIBR|nr:DNA polymerase III subunit delta [Vibrio europaeus]MDC5704630.1 DNA polymerase III subunit delta [Vibrio europaeus]MDC5712018.1 DNA polymerase III subunit delta [Vibrio europaeus]MDC5717746.1 DNA polymerase III subunit delta [Vibrio europaeus]MDC5718167.1 DNA polymerase III subunit delta [Vibrio europaeus]MDC5727753.1 DNA polymerase III subunit delta [Vibrio europaeus]
MRIFADRLVEQLNKQLHPTYLIFGNEPFLIQESRQSIQKAAFAQGFEERHRFAIDNSFDWNLVYDSCQAMSLFSARQVIELELPESGVNAAIAKELVAVAELLHSDVLLVVIGSKLTKAQENAKWFKALSSQGCWVNCLTPDIQRLPQFVQVRCRALNLKPDQEAVQMLAQWHEGNLFALTQSLEKLALLYPDGVLNLVRLEESLSRHNHFTAFHWVDALLAGKAKRSQRILRQLEAEGTESVILARTIQKELTQLLNMATQIKTKPIGQVFEGYRIWQSKRPLYSSALNRLQPEKIMQLLQLLAKVELLVKTQYDQSSWPLLHQLSTEICLPQVKL